MFCEIGAPQIEMGKVPGFISLCRNRLLKPWNGFIKTLQADEVGTNIIVGVAKFRIDFNRALAFRDSLIDLSLKVKRPSKECVSFGGRVQRKRSPVKLNGAIVVAFHLRLERFLQSLPSLLFAVSRHTVFGNTAPKCIKLR